MSHGRIERGAIGADVFGKHFTQIFNAALRDKRISWKAKGILSWLLSHQEGFSFSLAAIVAAGPEGEAAVRSALKELERFGYLRTERDRNARGQLGKTRYLVTDMPEGMPGLARYLEQVATDQFSIDRAGDMENDAEMEPEKSPRSAPHRENHEQGLTSGFSDHQQDRYPDGGFPHVANPHEADPAHKKITSEGDQFLPFGEGEEHSLATASGGNAASRGESDPDSRPTVEKITGPGAVVAFEDQPQGVQLPAQRAGEAPEPRGSGEAATGSQGLGEDFLAVLDEIGADIRYGRRSPWNRG